MGTLQDFNPLINMPLWQVYFLTVILLYVSIESGYRLGRYYQNHWPNLAESSVGSMLASTLAFLGFLLAFLVNMSVDIFNYRRALVVEEANAIETTYLRAGYLGEPISTEGRALLREYIDVRFAALDPSLREESIARSEEIHHELWGQVEILTQTDKSATTALYIRSLNEIIDIHAKRVNAHLQIRIPDAIQLSLYLVAIPGLVLVGLHNSYSSGRNIVAIMILILVFSLAFILIADLERSLEGFMQVSHEPLAILQKQFSTGP